MARFLDVMTGGGDRLLAALEMPIVDRAFDARA